MTDAYAFLEKVGGIQTVKKDKKATLTNTFCCFFDKQ